VLQLEVVILTFFDPQAFYCKQSCHVNTIVEHPWNPGLEKLFEVATLADHPMVRKHGEVACLREILTWWSTSFLGDKREATTRSGTECYGSELKQGV